MLVLESTDAKADAAAFQTAGIGDFEPFFFERQAKRPDGSTVRVAFSLAFAADPLAPECGFFVCQQHEPQNFWNPAFQQHANGASALSAAVMVTDDPPAHRGFLSAFAGFPEVLEGNADYVLGLPRGRLDVLDPRPRRRSTMSSRIRRRRASSASASPCRISTPWRTGSRRRRSPSARARTGSWFRPRRRWAA